MANEHYAQGRLDEAVELLSEIIRIDPIIRVTWYTLATIYEEEGEKEKAIQCKIVATHLSGSKQAAGDWADLGTESRDLGLLHQAIYCFTQAIKANKGDVNSMWDRAYLLKMSGASKMVRRILCSIVAFGKTHCPPSLCRLSVRFKRCSNCCHTIRESCENLPRCWRLSNFTRRRYSSSCRRSRTTAELCHA